MPCLCIFYGSEPSGHLSSRYRTRSPKSGFRVQVGSVGSLPQDDKAESQRIDRTGLAALVIKQVPEHSVHEKEGYPHKAEAK